MLFSKLSNSPRLFQKVNQNNKLFNKNVSHSNNHHIHHQQPKQEPYKNHLEIHRTNHHQHRNHDERNYMNHKEHHSIKPSFSYG